MALFLPSSLPLVPLAPPHVLYPHLSITLALPRAHIQVILDSIEANLSSQSGLPGFRKAQPRATTGRPRGNPTLTANDENHERLERSIDADGKGMAVEGRYVAVVPVVEIERRVGRWGTAARVRKVLRPEGAGTDGADNGEGGKGRKGEWRIVLEGLARIRLPHSLPPVLTIIPSLLLPISTYSLPLPPLSLPSAASPEDQSANPLLPMAIRILPTQIHDRLRLLPPGLMADVLVTVLALEWETRVELLGLPDVGERVERAREALADYMRRRGIKVPAASDAAGEPGQGDGKAGQGVVVLRRQPSLSGTAGARSALPGQPGQPGQPGTQIPEDLRPLFALFSSRLTAADLAPPVTHTLQRELTRLAKIPPQSAEYSVGRTYVEWLLALPWGRATEVPPGLDLAKCREVLEREHEGLDEVKRRVVEYLAVYRLKKGLHEEALKKADKDQRRRLVRSGKAEVDESTAKDLLALLPPEERRVQQAATSSGTQGSVDVGDDSQAAVDTAYRDKSPILLLVGPPGVGKTSIARSLAQALGRKFHRISLGGVRDEAEIRGHRRTYVGALPGALVQGLRKVGVCNPLILLDELDKVATSSFHGDPSAALLETLDPAQNHAFHDHYLGDLPIDLSRVLFVGTANTLSSISPPLLDRCEVIECSGYVIDEKMRIADRFLLPKQVKENGLEAVGVRMKDEVLSRLIGDYTREAGVRNLERELAKVCRTKAVEYSSSREKGGKEYDRHVTSADLEKILGVARYEQEVKEEMHRPGVVTGLAYQGSGLGGTLLIETTLVPGGKGRLVLTGSLGEVIRESAELALTFVKAHAAELGIEADASGDVLRGCDMHLHLPSGAVKKDGPSAGLGMCLAFISLLSARPVPSALAFTGELTLRGAVTPIGGVREKVLGAHRAGVSRVYLPERNRRDVESELKGKKHGVDVRYVADVRGAVREVWDKEAWKDQDVEGTGKRGKREIVREARL